MSVGVCIINGNGIALAADSAGTISYSGKNKMFYNSMNKVFNLSNKNSWVQLLMVALQFTMHQLKQY